jgi:3-dehydrosphinganine reductase
VFLAHAVIRLWISKPQIKETRRLVFTASIAAFVAIPGYVEYTLTKTALRVLADTLRQEVLMYQSFVDVRIHCSLPGTILTETFAKEQMNKPELCKQLEGSGSGNNALTPAAVATRILAGVEKEQYSITMDSQTALLLNNVRGPSPPASFLWDCISGFVVSLIWPFYWRMFDIETKEYGLSVATER